jgi:hypothetical protein
MPKDEKDLAVFRGLMISRHDRVVLVHCARDGHEMRISAHMFRWCADNYRKAPVFEDSAAL